MKNKFQNLMREVEAKYDELQRNDSFEFQHRPLSLPRKGVYCLSEKGRALYVGRSNNIPKRLQYHTRNNHNQATFAFLLARHDTGKVKASYRWEGSREHLLEDPVFLASFNKARERIKSMELRVVEEEDPTKQALLEIYTAYLTKARYNDFNNH